MRISARKGQGSAQASSRLVFAGSWHERARLRRRHAGISTAAYPLHQIAVPRDCSCRHWPHNCYPGYACKLSFVERLQSDCDCSWFRQLLDVDQLIAGAYLSTSDNVLHLGYYHGYNHERLSDTCSFSNHAGLHDLCLNLSESCDKSRSACCFRHQYASRAKQRIDDFTCTQGELLNGSRNARLHDRFIKFNFRLRSCGLGAGPLRRK